MKSIFYDSLHIYNKKKKLKYTLKLDAVLSAKYLLYIFI